MLGSRDELRVASVIATHGESIVDDVEQIVRTVGIKRPSFPIYLFLSLSRTLSYFEGLLPSYLPYHYYQDHFVWVTSPSLRTPLNSHNRGHNAHAPHLPPPGSGQHSLCLEVSRGPMRTRVRDLQHHMASADPAELTKLAWNMGNSV